MKLTPEMLTGKSREHLINLPTPHSPNHFLQAEAMKAFQGLQQSAVKNQIDFAIQQNYIVETLDSWQITEHGKLFLNELLTLFLDE